MRKFKTRRLSPPLWALGALGVSATAVALEVYLDVFTVVYPNTVGTPVGTCVACHVGTSTQRNPYGQDFATAKTGRTLAEALALIEELDSDGDGIPNGAEILSVPPSLPGDCTDPNPAGCGTTGGGGGDPPPIPPGTVTEGPTVVACYKWSDFPQERFALSIKRYGGLVTTEPRNDFIEAQDQTSHGIHGKHVGVCGQGSVMSVSGSLIKANDFGTQLGLSSMAVAGDGALRGKDVCRSVTIECFSEEVAQAPKEFKCFARNEFDVFHGESELKLVRDPASDPLCNDFGTLPDDDAEPIPASGLNLRRR